MAGNRRSGIWKVRYQMDVFWVRSVGQVDIGSIWGAGRITTRCVKQWKLVLWLTTQREWNTYIRVSDISLNCLLTKFVKISTSFKRLLSCLVTKHWKIMWKPKSVSCYAGESIKINKVQKLPFSHTFPGPCLTDCHPRHVWLLNLSLWCEHSLIGRVDML